MITLRLMMFVFAISSTTAFASTVQFNCKMNNGAATISGSYDGKKFTASITDPKGELALQGIENYPGLEFEVVTRVKEEKYTFAKFYNDYDAWYGLEIALPKSIVYKNQTGSFQAYFVIYQDDGDIMSPIDNQSFSCKTARRSI